MSGTLDSKTSSTLRGGSGPAMESPASVTSKRARFLHCTIVWLHPHTIVQWIDVPAFDLLAP
jgi:hypothetical protein